MIDEEIFSINFEIIKNNYFSISKGNKLLLKLETDEVIELEFIPREKPNEIIFDRTPYGSALNAQLSNS